LAEDSHKRPPGFFRAMLAEQRRVLTIKPRAPLALYGRVGHWFAATVLREAAPQLLAFGAIACAVALLLGAEHSALGALIVVLLVLAVIWEARMMWLAHRSIGVIDEALEDLEKREGPRVPRSHLALPPLMFVTRSVNRTRGVKFGEADGSALRLDIYRSSSPAEGGGPLPAVIQVHGGGWLSGSRYEQGIPLLNHLAGLGWVGFNIDYRLSPQASWPDHIVDVKRAIAWVRSNASELGIDPEMICMTGGSAGGHLTALAGLSENDPAFQPGFEDADTSLAAAVPFYGVYDLTDAGGVYYPELVEWVFEKIVVKQPLADAPEIYRAASPTWRVHADAPPFLVIHGDRDTLVPVGDARIFVERLREVSSEPVRYVELPGAEHAFDLWPSERTAAIAEGIGRFLTAVAERRGGAGSAPDARQELAQAS
jgi:acetyl esterase/lipase